jgi:Terminase large subunit, endonuclease domain
MTLRRSVICENPQVAERTDATLARGGLSTRKYRFSPGSRHGGHPVLTWCASNTKTQSDPAGNRKPRKRKGTGRIDGLVALAMAVHMITMAPPTKRESVYKTRGLLSLAVKSLSAAGQVAGSISVIVKEIHPAVGATDGIT